MGPVRTPRFGAEHHGPGTGVGVGIELALDLPGDPIGHTGGAAMSRAVAGEYDAVVGDSTAEFFYGNYPGGAALTRGATRRRAGRNVAADAAADRSTAGGTEGVDPG